MPTTDKPSVEPIAIKIVDGHEVKVYPYIAPVQIDVVWAKRKSGTRMHLHAYDGLAGIADYVATKKDQQ